MSFHTALDINPVCQIPVTVYGNGEIVLMEKLSRINQRWLSSGFSLCPFLPPPKPTENHNALYLINFKKYFGFFILHIDSFILL